MVARTNHVAGTENHARSHAEAALHTTNHLCANDLTRAFSIIRSLYKSSVTFFSWAHIGAGRASYSCIFTQSGAVQVIVYIARLIKTSPQTRSPVGVE